MRIVCKVISTLLLPVVVVAPPASPRHVAACAATQDASAAPRETAAPREEVKLVAALAGYKGPSMMQGRGALVEFSPDGRLLATSGAGGTVKLWDTSTGELKATLRAEKGPLDGFAFSRDGRRAATRDMEDKGVTVWDAETWQPKVKLAGRKKDLETKLKAAAKSDLNQEFLPVQFSPDGRLVLTERNDDVADLWDAETGAAKATLEHRTETNAAKDALKLFIPFAVLRILLMRPAFSPDGTRVVTTNGDKLPKLWDAATGKLVAALEGHTARVYRAYFTPDGKVFGTIGTNGVVNLWDTATGRLVSTIGRERKESIYGLKFSPDSRLAATFLEGGTHLWEVATGKLVHTLSTKKAEDVAFHPGGRLLATAGDDSKATVRLWDVETGQARVTVPKSGDEAEAVEFSPDGRLFATAGDKGVKLWDASTGAPLASLNEARYPLAFSPDSRLLATGGRRDTAMLWSLPPAR
jgi:WD40 repeat protein